MDIAAPMASAHCYVCTAFVLMLALWACVVDAQRQCVLSAVRDNRLQYLRYRTLWYKLIGVIGDYRENLARCMCHKWALSIPVR